MKVLTFLACLVIVQSGTIPDNNENSCKYNKEVLKDDINHPYNLVLDIRTNVLYFSYATEDEEDLGGFQSSFINLKTKEYGEIKDIPKGFAQTVDQETHKVYIGGSDGIYKYDYKTKKSEFITAKGKDIWMVYAKDVLFYTVFPEQIVNVVTNGVTERFKDLEDIKVDAFIIDNEDEIFFSNFTGLYSQKKGTKDAKHWHNDIIVIDLATDINGEVYACLKDGIYRLNKNDLKLVKIVDIDGAFGLAFDSDNNIIYSGSDQVVRLTVGDECNTVAKEIEQ